MKKTILAALFGILSLSSFTMTVVGYEQIAFDYFITKIIKSDFKTLSEIEFKGKTESDFSTLGDYKFCLKPEEKLQGMIKSATKQSFNTSKDVRFSTSNNLSISELKDDSKAAKLYIYSAVRVADNFYVFLSVQQQGSQNANYVIELNADGEILRYCKM